MRRWSIGRLAVTIAGSVALWAAVAAACLCVGSTGWKWPHGGEMHYRLGMVLLSSLIGASLAAAGAAYQAILRNPLADPYLLGISSGASLLACAWHFGWLGFLGSLAASAAGQQAAAFLGAVLSVVLILSLAQRRGRLEPVTLLLVGVIVNAVNSSIFLLLNAVRKEMSPGAGSIFRFMVGGIPTDVAPELVRSSAWVIGVGWVVLLYLSGELNVAALSEAEAEALGVRIQRLRWIALVVASLMTAAGVALSGPIGFVGLVCPHLARLIVGSDQRRLLPVATALGAALLAVAEAASRGLIREANTWLPVGVLTGLMGGPFFLFLLWQSRRSGTIRGFEVK